MRKKYPESTSLSYSLDLFKQCQPKLTSDPPVSCISSCLCLLDSHFSGLTIAHILAGVSVAVVPQKDATGISENLTCDHHPASPGEIH